MAKKKNAPILRGQSEGGDKPITTTVTKSYAVRDEWLNIAKDNLVEFKSVNGEISDLKVNGEPASGGGLKTFTVNIINDGQAEVTIYLPTVIPQFPTFGINTVFSLDPGTDTDVLVVANQDGSTTGAITSTGQFHATGNGNVTVTNNTFIQVDGDGGISIGD